MLLRSHYSPQRFLMAIPERVDGSRTRHHRQLPNESDPVPSGLTLALRYRLRLIRRLIGGNGSRPSREQGTRLRRVPLRTVLTVA